MANPTASEGPDLAALCARIAASVDVVEVLTVLLSFCRANAHVCAAMVQSSEGRSTMAAIANRARRRLRSSYLSATDRDAIIDVLASHDPILAARGIAVGIDQFVHGMGYRTYRALLVGRGPRDLKDESPYPTTPVDLTTLYPGLRGFTSLPRDAGSVLAVDRVGGLALWNAAEFGSLRVIYDPDAGAALDHALGDSVSALLMTPNQRLAQEFTIDEVSTSGFFGVRVVDKARQNQIFAWALDHCRTNGVELLMLPELSATESFGDIVDAAVNSHESKSSAAFYPSVVLAGSEHTEADGRRVNRMSIMYPRDRHHVVHDKIGRYVNGPSEVRTADGWTTNLAGEENIDRSTVLHVHAGIRWSMIPLICADFLDETVVDAVAALHPTLVLVSAMTEKTGGFENSAGTVISAGQATVMVANGPVDWSAEDSPDTFGGVATALVVMPFADREVARVRHVPRPEDPAPRAIGFSMASAGLEVITTPDFDSRADVHDDQVM
ncbi:hypothetical protein ABLE92_12310 [Gordonia sp. VNQ95]|uniref:hypothetical protein n=1 Tax=Gordonia sp. VNQ95 TaxID=3156619 RepID=UPI0032B44CCE